MPDGPPPNLTPRQREVVGLVVDGLSYPRVAARLGITESTVRRHVEEVSRRLRGFGPTPRKRMFAWYRQEEGE